MVQYSLPITALGIYVFLKDVTALWKMIFTNLIGAKSLTSQANLQKHEDLIMHFMTPLMININ